MKKVIYFIILITLTCISAWSQTAARIDGMVFSIKNSDSEDGYAELTKIYEHKEHIVVPASVESKGRKYPVTHLADQSFRSDSIIRSIELPEGLINIGAYAFWYCKNLEYIGLPASLEFLGMGCFSNCESLLSITFPDDPGVIECDGWDEYDNTSSTKPFYKTPIREVYYGKRMVRQYSKETSVFPVETLQKVTIGTVISSIPEYAFSNCGMLKSVEFISDNVKSIEGFAFYNCGSLTKLVLPESLTTIGDKAFASSGVVDVNFPMALETIGYGAFSDTNISTPPLLRNLKVLRGGAFKNCKNVTSIDFLPTAINTLESSVFSGCGLRSVKIPKSIKKINSSAFANCTELENVIWSGEVTEIYEFAFQNTNLKSISVPASVEFLGRNIVSGSPIESFIIESSPHPIKMAFNENYQTPTPPAFGKNLKSTYIGRSIDLHIVNSNSSPSTDIFTDIFKKTELTDLKFGKDVKFLCRNLFSNCDMLKEVILPDGLEELPDNLFRNCEQLEKITIGTTTKHIGICCFRNSPNIIEVNVRAAVPPGCDIETTFDPLIYTEATLHVPEEALEEYESTLPWALFDHIVGDVFAELDKVGDDHTAEATPVEWFNLSGVKVSGEKLPAGIYIRRQGAKVEKVAL